MSEHTTPLPIVAEGTAAPASSTDESEKKSIGFRVSMLPRETIMLSVIALLLATGPLRNWILVPGILILATGAFSVFTLGTSLLMGAISKTPKSRTATAYRIAWVLILLWVALIMF